MHVAAGAGKATRPLDGMLLCRHTAQRLVCRTRHPGHHRSVQQHAVWKPAQGVLLCVFANGVCVSPGGVYQLRGWLELLPHCPCTKAVLCCTCHMSLQSGVVQPHVALLPGPVLQ